MSVDDASDALSEVRSTLLVIGTYGPRGPHFMVGNWGTQASFDPWRFVMALKNSARTLAYARDRGAFTVNLVDREREELVMGILRAKGEGFGMEKGPLDAPRLAGAFAGFDVRVTSVHDEGGDHRLVVGEVMDGWRTGEGPALTVDETGLAYSG